MKISILDGHHDTAHSLACFQKLKLLAPTQKNEKSVTLLISDIFDQIDDVCSEITRPRNEPHRRLNQAARIASGRVSFIDRCKPVYGQMNQPFGETLDWHRRQKALAV